MSELTLEQRGDMAQALLPEAAGMIVDVHEGSADDVKKRLSGLTRHELEGMAVLLAALADPERGVREALAWVNFDENGNRISPSEQSGVEKPLRDVSPKLRRQLAGVDVVAVHRALAGAGQPVPLTVSERRMAIEVGHRRGMPRAAIAQRLGMTEDAVSRTWERVKERARKAGDPVPVRGDGVDAA
jgi:hypothetical protein